jgi:hypothetical protein
MKPSSRQQVDALSRRPRRLLVAFCACALGWLHLSGPAPWTVHGNRETDDFAEKLSAAQARLEAYAKTQQAAQATDLAETRSRIARIVAEAEAKCPGISREATAPLTEFRGILRCVALGAKDSVTGSEELGRHLADVLEPATALVLGARARIEGEITAFRHRSLARVNDYARESLEIAEAARLAPPALGIDPRFSEQLVRSSIEVGSRWTSATVAVAIEAVLVQQTWEVLGRVLRPLITRAAKTLGLAGGAAVVDGPVPAGDVIAALIAIGGAAFTTWEVYQAIEKTRGLPGEVEAALRQQLKDLGNASDLSLDALLIEFPSVEPGESRNNQTSIHLP